MPQLRLGRWSEAPGTSRTILPARSPGGSREASAATGSADYDGKGVASRAGDLPRRQFCATGSGIVSALPVSGFLGFGAGGDRIAFPYRRNGELVNIKFRSVPRKPSPRTRVPKKSSMASTTSRDSKPPSSSRAKSTSWPWRKLACSMWSVPDGAPNRVKLGRPRTTRSSNTWPIVRRSSVRLKKIILGVDADAKGAVLEEELARRLGKERCWRDVARQRGCALQRRKPDFPGSWARSLSRVHRRGHPYPIAGLHRMADYFDEILAVYDSLTETGSPKRGLVDRLAVSR